MVSLKRAARRLKERATDAAKGARQSFVNWLVRDVTLNQVHVQNARFGENSISISPDIGGVKDLLRWSGTQAALAPGDLGMSTATGRPSFYYDGAARQAGSHQETHTPVTALLLGGEATVATLNGIGTSAPVGGAYVITGASGTPTEGSSDLLNEGDLAEWDGTSWKKLVANDGGALLDGLYVVKGPDSGETSPLLAAAEGDILLTVGAGGDYVGAVSNFVDTGQKAHGKVITVQERTANATPSALDGKRYIYSEVSAGFVELPTGSGNFGPTSFNVSKEVGADYSTIEDALTAAEAAIDGGAAGATIFVGPGDYAPAGGELSITRGGISIVGVVPLEGGWDLTDTSSLVLGAKISGRVTVTLGAGETYFGMRNIQVEDGSAVTSTRPVTVTGTVGTDNVIVFDSCIFDRSAGIDTSSNVVYLVDVQNQVIFRNCRFIQQYGVGSADAVYAYGPNASSALTVEFYGCSWYLTSNSLNIYGVITSGAGDTDIIMDGCRMEAPLGASCVYLFPSSGGGGLLRTRISNSFFSGEGSGLKFGSNYSSEVLIDNCEMQVGNSTTEYGVEYDASGPLYLRNCRIDAGYGIDIASTAGAVEVEWCEIVASAGYTLVGNTSFSAKHSNFYSVGIYAIAYSGGSASSNFLRFDHCLLRATGASGRGLGILTDRVFLEAYHTTFAGDGSGGYGIYNAAGTVTSTPYTKLYHCTARGEAYGLYLLDDQLITAENCYFYGNTLRAVHLGDAQAGKHQFTNCSFYSVSGDGILAGWTTVYSGAGIDFRNCSIVAVHGLQSDATAGPEYRFFNCHITATYGVYVNSGNTNREAIRLYGCEVHADDVARCVDSLDQADFYVRNCSFSNGEDFQFAGSTSTVTYEDGYLDDLHDVVESGSALQHVLRHNGTTYVNVKEEKNTYVVDPSDPTCYSTIAAAIAASEAAGYHNNYEPAIILLRGDVDGTHIASAPYQERVTLRYPTVIRTENWVNQGRQAPVWYGSITINPISAGRRFSLQGLLLINSSGVASDPGYAVQFNSFSGAPTTDTSILLVSNCQFADISDGVNREVLDINTQSFDNYINLDTVLLFGSWVATAQNKTSLRLRQGAGRFDNCEIIATADYAIQTVIADSADQGQRWFFTNSTIEGPFYTNLTKSGINMNHCQWSIEIDEPHAQFGASSGSGVNASVLQVFNTRVWNESTNYSQTRWINAVAPAKPKVYLSNIAYSDVVPRIAEADIDVEFELNPANALYTNFPTRYTGRGDNFATFFVDPDHFLDVESAANGNVLQYDNTGTPKKWAAVTPGAMASSINLGNLGDVTPTVSTAPLDTYVLAYSVGSSAWIQNSPATVASNHSLNDVGDVNSASGLGTANSYQGLYWNTSAWQPKFRQSINGVSFPTTGDDSADNYEQGSLWFNTVRGVVHGCWDATASNAIWEVIGNSPTTFVVSKQRGAKYGTIGDAVSAAQAAIGAAAIDYATILIGPGEWSENVTITTSGIQLVGQAPVLMSIDQLNTSALVYGTKINGRVQAVLGTGEYFAMKNLHVYYGGASTTAAVLVSQSSATDGVFNFENLLIENNNTGTANEAFQFTNVNEQVSMRNVTVLQKVAEDAILFDGVQTLLTLTMDRCIVRHTGLSATTFSCLRSSAGQVAIVLDGCEFHSNSSRGITLGVDAKNSSNYIRRSVISVAEQGIYLVADFQKNLEISYCSVRSVSNHGMTIFSNPVSATSIDVMHCTFDAPVATSNAINVTAGANVTVNHGNNLFRDSDDINLNGGSSTAPAIDATAQVIP